MMTATETLTKGAARAWQERREYAGRTEDYATADCKYAQKPPDYGQHVQDLFTGQSHKKTVTDRITTATEKSMKDADVLKAQTRHAALMWEYANLE